MLTFGRVFTARRWNTWRDGAPQGDPRTWQLRAAIAPAGPASDPASRRGTVIPTDTLLVDFDVELAPHDLLSLADGSRFEVTGPVQRYEHPMTGWRPGATTEVTRFVDSGPESALVFPSTETVDGYGNPTRTPAATGILVDGVTVEPIPAPEDTGDGQRAPARFRLVGRGLDVLDPFSEVEWPVGSGRRLEVTDVPVHWTWPRWSAYTQATLRERT